jgi:hypothetical protein
MLNLPEGRNPVPHIAEVRRAKRSQIPTAKTVASGINQVSNT